ncbi:hypothetical protein PTTG_29999, partial [Puccinia triticina 1-1 BBBD Race 1]
NKTPTVGARILGSEPAPRARRDILQDQQNLLENLCKASRPAPVRPFRFSLPRPVPPHPSVPSCLSALTHSAPQTNSFRTSPADLVTRNVDEGFLRAHNPADAYFLAHAKPTPTTASLFSEHHTPQAPANLLRGFRPEPLRPAKQHWPQWAAELRQGFSLLFHGLGSKRATLNYFLHEHLVPRLGWEALVINGFQANATLPAILAELEAIILDHPSPASSNDEDQPHHHAPRKASSLEALEAQAQCLCSLLSRRRQHDQPDIVLLLHNLDGHGFRSPKIQTILGLLVAQPSLHLLATLDHIHAPAARPPLASAFNFLYHQLPTPTGYVLESLLGTTFDALLPPSILLPSGLLLPTRIAAGLAPPAASFPTVGATGPAAVHVNLGQAGFVFIEANVVVDGKVEK